VISSERTHRLVFSKILKFYETGRSTVEVEEEVLSLKSFSRG